MWASKTDYAKLYSPEYFGKSSGSASYNGSDFERVFFNLCKASNVDALVDVGSGSGKLKQSAVLAGMTVFSCDFDPVDKDAFHFDLSLEDADAAATLYNQIGDRVGSAEYITTCLDVLEHIDIEDVSNALWNLHTIIRNLAVVSVSTRPSSRGNKYHSTVLPLSTWKYLFELSGFEIVDPHFCSEGRRILPLTSNDPLLGLVTHWAQADIFRDRLDGEPTYLLLRKAVRPTDKENCLLKTDAVLDIAYRKEKRLAFDERRLEAIALNIGHFQDFLTLRPLLDIIPRGECSALIRRDVLNPDEMSMIVGFFERNGIPVVIYRTAAEIDWRVLPIRTLVSGSESSAAVSHSLNAQVVEAAKLWGIKTVLLQHGIWIEPMQDREINFASDTILAWGAEHERCFRNGKHSVAGISRSYSAQNDSRFKAAGSPKFHDSLLQTNSDVLRWRLGIDISKYNEHVLVGTNLKWHQHQDKRSHILAGIRRMIQSNPEKLFIVKPHPSERHFEYAELRADNTLVLDDILLGCIDFSISRLLGGISTVVSSLSTLLLDGAVLGRRCIQYDTGNVLHYELCKPISVNDLHLAIKNPLAASLSSNDFASYYNDAGNDHFYEVFAEVVGDQSVQSNSAARYSDLKSVEDAWISLRNSEDKGKSLEQEVDALKQENSDLSAQVENLKQEKDGLSVRVEALDVQRDELIVRSEEKGARLYEEVGKLRSALHEIHTSTSWKITAPYRWIGSLFHSLSRLNRRS